MSAAVTWLQNNLGMDVTGEWARHIHLNVGGIFYTTRRHTLRNLREHPLFGSILSGRGHKCEDGSFLIDGDGALFRYILDYLRNGTLNVPDNFHEWGMLLQEVRRYQLPELEQLVLGCFDYQRCVFKRQLPHGVYVWWPDTPHTSPSAGAVDNADRKPPSQTALPPHHHSEASHVGVTPARRADTKGGSAGSSTAATTGGIVAPLSPPLPSLPSGSYDSSPHSASSSCVRIVPPLPGLEVNATTAATGASVTFRSSQVLVDLDQLVTVLLTAYGYTIQHWDEAHGRVLLTLPGAL
ncbi:hypothetical protein ABB37_06127 [Leptomonas pyrrhocoris]|uniref:Potassium channel tetramerisation-type BTB domain-containing protein n=1 Tax=Leptomonas pyrrhocoris TaxID=157538 RepID=A0A0M9FY54_LEPPY|nr:hypothetical protein ABB37_06127 [Leptomonas pyrrhocoris]XP_015656959.1 hypothetical protein ABB37_06127 [Leptomonas pyrrhocoris]KPA78519.1 hypothetical protein ABB37_06127 [Leptomonas pyrrhocoris]KPA78520.1 hypothetical protein ABB37_06127 [Leptomonas pyrrhocoris]|eukprot:XP_015656958.1 hypothetical protein ABB37_06127 [Leptomonas pyrrhocoris]